MKRILFTTIPEKGHINPMIGPAAHLQRRGHEVAFFAACDVSTQVGRAGLKTVPGLPPAPPPADANRGETFARQVRDAAWLRAWIKRLLIDAAESQIKPLAAAIAEFRPEIIVTDPMIYAAAIAAHAAGVPWVALSNSLNPVLDDSVQSDLLDTVAWLAPERTAVFARHGVKVAFRGCDMLSPTLTIAFTTSDFIGREVPGVEMVGPSIPPSVRGDEADFPWDQLRDDRPVVYLSFGSQIYHQPEIFRRAMAATRDLGVQLVIIANRLHGALGELPAHVLTCHYAPQLALLRRVNVCITHGGANSVMEALHFGVPLLISPVCNDQFHQAHFVARSGAGLVLDLTIAAVDELRTAIERLLVDADICAAVGRIAASYRTDGAARAADLIERLS
jgi:MGT family glycosyltransferase